MFIEAAKSILLVVSALFPIVDPIGGAPVFLSLTLNYDRDTRRLLARRIAMNSFILMLASYAIGSHVLAFFGISLPVVQVGGGMIVVASGWALLKEKDGNDRNAVERTVSGTDVLRDAFYPLTPVAITLGANEPHTLGGSILLIIAAAIASAFVAATIYLCYAFSDRLALLLGPTGTNVIVKLTSFLLVCIGVQIVWNGVSQLLRSLPHFG